MPVDPFIDTDAITLWAIDVGLFGFMNSKWGWPIIESLHFVGLSLLIGTVGLFDLRLLGFAKGLEVRALHRFVPLGVAGFLLNATTGSMFFLAAPAQYLHNPAFQLKAMCLLMAGLNMVMFYAIASRPVLMETQDIRIPISAKVFAVVSLGSWIGVIAFGRLLTFFRPPYFWCFWC